MPDPRLLSALMLWTFFNTLRKGHVDARKVFSSRDPVSLFLTDERSDAAVVGSGNKAMGKSPLLTFRSWDNLKLAGLGALRAHDGR